MSLGGVIARLPHGTYLVTRRDAGAYVGGGYAVPPVLNLAVTAVDPNADTVTVPAHGLKTAQGPLYPSSAAALPSTNPAGALAADLPVWPIVLDTNTFKLASSSANALAAAAIDLVDAGGGGLTLSSQFTITAGIQPLRGRELQDLPEGQRADETRILYTTTPLRTRQPGAEADLVTIDGEVWRVDTVDSWPSYYRCVITRAAIP